MSRTFTVLLIFVFLLIIDVAHSIPVLSTSTESLLIVTKTTNDAHITESNKNESALHPPELKSMYVISNVTNRYARTIVSSRYKNSAEKSQEATFSIILPETAFISGFLMQIRDKVYEAYVKEKEEAKRTYEQAVQSGFSAAHVELQNARDSNRFTVSVNIEPLSKVTFNLTYEQLLVRKHGKYELVVNLHPGQLVKDLIVDVNINETVPLINVRTPPLHSGNEIVEDSQNIDNNEYATITKIGDGKAVRVHFAPTVQQQKEMAKKINIKSKNDDDDKTNEEKKIEAISGQFIVEYDVERNSQGGQVLVNDGYFVHFFAPSDLKPLPKHVIFVLDVSGSMSGRKIEQLKQAMHVILDQLNPNDYFNLIEFSFGAKVWNFNNVSLSPIYETSRRNWWRPNQDEDALIPKVLPPAYPVNPENKNIAKSLIEKMNDGGGTNIYDALHTALTLSLNGVVSNANETTPQPIIIFLTDGDATDGETSTKAILNMVSELNRNNSAAIFSLAFGYDANKDILKKLSLRNSGFMRQIYEAADASLQLQDFYKQISSPLLANVTFTYPEVEANSLTQHKFHTLFDGSELVVAGKIENPKDKILYVHGLTLDGPIDFPPVIVPIPVVPDSKRDVGPLERLWAYMTIRQLLDKRDGLIGDETNGTEASDIYNKALKLALKYSFVTPVSSLVVVKPNETEQVNTEEAKETEADGYYQGGFIRPQAFYASGAVLSLSEPDVAFDLTDSEEPSKIMSFDSGSGSSFVLTTTTPQVPLQRRSEFLELQWLQSLFSDSNHIVIDGISYILGNNETVISETKNACTVKSKQLSSTCTLLSSCIQTLSKIDSLQTFKTEYFCALDNNTYAGVCCINSS